MIKLTESDKKFLSNYINSVYLKDDILIKLQDKFRNERYVKHIALPNFLKKELLIGVLKDIEDKNCDNTNLYFDLPGVKKGTGAYFRGQNLSYLWDLFYSKSFFHFMEIFLGYQVHAPRFFGEMLEYYLKKITGRTGLLLQLYNATDYLAWHTDGPTEEICGSYVLNLNSKWFKSQGGELELGYKIDINDRDPVGYKKILPQLNMLILMKCEKDVSWHRVCQVHAGQRITFHDQLFYKK